MDAFIHYAVAAAQLAADDAGEARREDEGAVGDRQATLGWAAPAANGAPITGYLVRSSDGSVAQQCAGTQQALDDRQARHPVDEQREETPSPGGRFELGCYSAGHAPSLGGVREGPIDRSPVTQAKQSGYGREIAPA